MPRRSQDNIEVYNAFLVVKELSHHGGLAEFVFVSAEICEAGSELPEDTEGCGSS